MASTDKRRNLQAWKKKRSAAKAKAKAEARRGIPCICFFCKQEIDLDANPSAGEAWTLHHLEPLNTGGHITGPTEPAHRSCNSSYGDGTRQDPLQGQTRNW